MKAPLVISESSEEKGEKKIKMTIIMEVIMMKMLMMSHTKRAISFRTSEDFVHSSIDLDLRFLFRKEIHLLVFHPFQD